MAGHVEKLAAEIAEALAANEQHAEASDDATERYHAAVAAGDLEAARQHQAEAEEQERVAGMHGDRWRALKARLPEARRKDSAGKHKALCAELNDTTQAARAARDRAAAAAAAYVEAVDEMATETGRMRSTIVRLGQLAETDGHAMPEVLRLRLDVHPGLHEAWRRHGRISGDVSQFVTERGVPAKFEAA